MMLAMFEAATPSHMKGTLTADHIVDKHVATPSMPSYCCRCLFQQLTVKGDKRS
jgi:hypothetical protein